MPPPMNQEEARQILTKIIKDVEATLVSPTDGVLDSRTSITYLCGGCGVQNTKDFNNLKKGPGGALCKPCAQTRGKERRIESLKSRPKSINNGETDFNRDLAIKTASKNGSKLLGIYSRGDDGSYIKISDDNWISRDCYLHIRCVCGNKDYVNFRNAYGHAAIGAGNGLCVCAGCRKGHRSAALRKIRRGDDSTDNILIESMPKRAERIEKEGQECTDCKIKKPASDFFAKFNTIENCKVYKGRCYSCSRKRRTSNREDTLRNGSIEDFMKGELVIAKDRVKKHNKRYPDDTREFNITVEFLMELLENQGGRCAISGLQMLTTTHRDECPEGERCNPNKLSIDRIDSLRGYTEDNVQLVRWRTNSMKMDMTSTEYKEEIRAQYEYLFKMLPVNEIVEN